MQVNRGMAARRPGARESLRVPNLAAAGDLVLLSERKSGGQAGYHAAGKVVGETAPKCILGRVGTPCLGQD